MTQQTPEQIAQNVARQALAEREKRVRVGAWTGNARPHTDYQKRPIDWLVDVLGYRREDLVWSLRAEYNSHVWSGTKDPLATAIEALSDGKWAGIESGSGTGKAAWIESHVLTPTGFVRMGDIRVGDAVIGSGGKPTQVLGVFPQGIRSIYRVTFSDGAEALVDGEHLWRVRSRKMLGGAAVWRTLTTTQIKHDIRRRWFVPIVGPVEFPRQALGIHPYVMGVLLGDGHLSEIKSNLGITSADREIVEAVERLGFVRLQRRGSYDYRIRDCSHLYECLESYDLVGKLSWQKHVPHEYLHGDVEQRLALLQGLMDTDGTVDKRTGSLEYSTTSLSLVRDVKSLVCSLGGVGTVAERTTSYTYKGQKKKGRLSYRLVFVLPNLQPFRLARKAQFVKRRGPRNMPHRYIENVEFAFNGEAQCIRVAAADSLYVMDDHVVTHNTHAAAGITLWFLACWENSRVFSIAPREDQLELNLWKEITKLWPKFQKHFPTAELGKLTLRVRGGIDDTWSAHGITARVGSDEDVAGRMRGFHEAHQMFIVEEGPGVDDAIWETIESTSGGSHNLVLGLGNPDSVHDPLHRFCIKSRVVNGRISCFDHPNVVCDNPEIIPGATSRDWIADRAEKWGEGTNKYLRFVQGIAPAQAEDALILLEWCEAAALRWGDQKLREGPRALGVDVADSPTGDESAISRWQGACCTEVVSFRLEDASAVGRKVYQEIKDPNAPIDPKRVGIDSVGVGVSTINELKRLDIRVRHIFGGARAGPFADVEAKPEPAEEGEEKKKRRNIVVDVAVYDNLRSQVLWRLREDLRLQRIALPPDKELFRQLTAFTHKPSPTTGKTIISSTDEVRTKIRRSPDKAMALAYGNWVRYRKIAQDDEPPQEAPTPRFMDTRFEKLVARHDKNERARERARKQMVSKLKLKPRSA